MGFLDDIAPKASLASLLGGVTGGSSIGVSDRSGKPGSGEKIADAGQLREWRCTIPLVFRACRFRVNKIVNAKWDIVPLNPKKPYSEALRQEIKAFFDAPNPKAENNSYAGLWKPNVDDMIVVGVGAILKNRTKGKLSSLACVDAARVEFLPWDGDPKTPRYFLYDQDGINGKLLLNSDLITLVPNPVSTSQKGIAPLAVLYNTLSAYVEWMESVRTVQRNRGPGLWINIDGAGDRNIRAMKHRYQTTVQANQAIMWSDFPKDDITSTQMGDINLMQQGAFPFHDIIVREICAGLDMSPMDLMQEQDTHKTSADVQSDMSIDDGAKPIMQDLQGFKNREIVAEWGAPLEINLGFAYLNLEEDEPGDAASTRVRFGKTGEGSWLGVNESRIEDGLDPIPATGDPIVDALLNEPRVSIGTGIVAPLSIAARILRALPESDEALALPGSPSQAAPAESDGAPNPDEQETENEPAPQQAPKRGRGKSQRKATSTARIVSQNRDQLVQQFADVFRESYS